MAKCIVCGRDIKINPRYPGGKPRVLCGDPECFKIHKKELNKKTNAKTSIKRKLEKEKAIKDKARKRANIGNKSLADFAKEASEHGMTYGQYQAYLYSQK